jgi:hypothetical protein
MILAVIIRMLSISPISGHYIPKMVEGPFSRAPAPLRKSCKRFEEIKIPGNFRPGNYFPRSHRIDHPATDSAFARFPTRPAINELFFFRVG